MRVWLAPIAVLCWCAMAHAAEPAPAPKPEAPAAESPGPWLAPTPPSEAPRLQRKLYPKLGRFQLDLAGQYLWRADFFYNPGLGATVRYYAYENIALELSGTRFFSSMQPTAKEVRDRFGWVPDAHESQWLVRAGARASLGYGKFLFGRKVIHVEPQAAVNLGWLIGDASNSFGATLSGGFLIHWTKWLHSTFELVLFPHAEKRTNWETVMGVMPSLGVGVGWPP